MKIDPLTGMLVQIIVVEAPPMVEELVRTCPDVMEHGAVVVDRSPWAGRDAQVGAAFDRPVATTVEELSLERMGDRISIVFSGQDVTKHFFCGDVIVAVSKDRNLVEISAPVKQLSL